MARRRFRRKDLKRPDEFVSRGRQVLEWAQENIRTVSWTAGGIVALALLVTGVFSVRAARIRQANDDLSHALDELRAGHYSQAATQLGEVATRWQSTAAGRMARLYAANADLKAEDAGGATVQLQQALDANDWPPYLRQSALVSLGFALARKGDLQGASARYNEAAALDGPYTALAVLGEARCREQLGEKDKALALYERFKTEFPQATELDVVDARIGALKS